MAQFDAPSRTFVAGRGNYLIDANGHEVFDAVSSIWTTIHGHCHPHIARRIAEQAQTLDHATLLGATNPLAQELATRLCARSVFDYAFFSSDGASAIEVALKIALQYWQNRGEPERTRFVRLTNAYHGDTAGAMSVSDIAVFKERFAAMTFSSFAYEAAFEVLKAPDVAAIIAEPLVQAASGMHAVPRELYAALDGRNALLIVDEIATGFGRTGTMFAYEQLNVRPDLLCLGKGITGGTLALSATLATARIYEEFLGTHQQNKQLFHGHSYAGNPIACAAALASLELFDEEATLASVQALIPLVNDELARMLELRNVRAVRGAGLMRAVELETQLIDKENSLTPAWRVADALYGEGYFTRPIGDAIQFVPPLSTTPDEVHGFFNALLGILS